MKFQDSSFNGLKVTVGTKNVTHARTDARTHAPKAICPINFFKDWGINKAVPVVYEYAYLNFCSEHSPVTEQTCIFNVFTIIPM